MVYNSNLANKTDRNSSRDRKPNRGKSKTKKRIPKSLFNQ